MPPRRSHPRKRAAPDVVADVGSTLGEPQHDPAQIEWNLKIERLRLENQRLREEIVRSKSQASFTTFSLPPAPMPRRVARQVLGEEGRSSQDFLGLGTLEFKGGAVMVR